MGRGDLDVQRVRGGHGQARSYGLLHTDPSQGLLLLSTLRPSFAEVKPC